MDLYAENILDHYRHPRCKTRLPSPTVTHDEVNLSCGDAVTLDLLINGDHLQEIGWEGGGCAISQAAMSLLSEKLQGESLEDVESLKKEDVYELLGVPVGPRRTKCALLGFHTLKNALRKFHGEQSQGWMDTVESGAAHGN
ncbi:MAG: iron-sulfur cluster assembly scaffold protein [Candidatus Peribacteraceae bacterium]|nr:iron-sulfur cluster assembly scaffold protein [Candidatus Peribacteraceae bacterium]